MFLLIENYMRNLKEQDVNQFAIKNNVYLSGGELKFIYNYVKENWKIILKNPDNLNLDQHRSKFSPHNFNKLKFLLNEYYQKYGHYL